MIDDITIPGSYNVLQDKIKSIFVENLPDVNEDKANIFEELKTQNKVKHLCCIEHIKQRKKVGMDVKEGAKHAMFVKNTMSFRTHANQVK